MPDNGKDVSGWGSYYVLYSYPWGYADNHPNDSIGLNSFDIGWAVDSQGNKVSLPGADFIRVYTGVNQYCGWVGETLPRFRVRKTCTCRPTCSPMRFP